MHAAQKPKAEQAKAHAVYSRLSIMELSILSALTKTSRNLGVLQHPTMTLTECGDTALVRKYTGYFVYQPRHMANILSFGWFTKLTSFNFCDGKHQLLSLFSGLYSLKFCPPGETRETTEVPKATKFTSSERLATSTGTQASSESTTGTESHVTSHATHAYTPVTTAATETPVSDEFGPSSTVGTTPMPSTFAGKLQDSELCDRQLPLLRPLQFRGLELFVSLEAK